jgi:hypothetical protein
MIGMCNDNHLVTLSYQVLRQRVNVIFHTAQARMEKVAHHGDAMLSSSFFALYWSASIAITTDMTTTTRFHDAINGDDSKIPNKGRASETPYEYNTPTLSSSSWSVTVNA